MQLYFRYEEVIRNADRFLNLLEDFTSLGSAMRTVMTQCLTDGESYQVIGSDPLNDPWNVPQKRTV